MILGLGEISCDPSTGICSDGDGGTFNVSLSDAAAVQVAYAMPSDPMETLPSYNDLVSAVNANNFKTDIASQSVSAGVSQFFSQNGQAIVAVCAVLGLVVTVKK